MYSAIHDIDEEPNVKDGEQMLLHRVYLTMIICVTSGVDYFHIITLIQKIRITTISSPVTTFTSPAPPRLSGLRIMFSVLLIFAYDGGCGPWGHGGDGAGDPPIPPGGFRGTHETDAVPPKKVRGKAKNEKLRRLVKVGGGGGLYRLRLAGSSRLPLLRTIPFDKIGWDNVEQHYKDAVMNHLREIFNFDEVERDYEAKNLKGGIRSVLMKRYTDRKYEARQLFDSQGGYDDLERARAYHPADMPYENWLRTIEGFRQEKYIKKGKANKLVRDKQQFPYRGGTSSYGSTAYKNVMFYDLDWVPTYAKTHTDNQGNWVDPVAEQNYVSISFNGTYNRPPMNGAAMVLQLPRIKKRWESCEDGTAGWGLNLLPTHPRTRPRTCRLRKLGRKNPFPRILLTACFKLCHF
ncbi:hypothetical protein Hanom_Chr03g00187841 [Helianthus anomalus]